MRLIHLLVLVMCTVLLSGCFARESWTRSDLFSTADAAKSKTNVEAEIESIAFPGGIQRGLNLNLDNSVMTDQGSTSRIYLEQTTQLSISIILLRRVRVHFDDAGSPLYLERIENPISP